MDVLLTPPKKPDRWNREPWMLLVFGGPAIVVVAALYTAFLAYSGADKVIAEDYYRQGLAINQDLRRDANARAYRMRAAISFDAAAGKISMHLEGDAGSKSLPPVVNLIIGASANSLTTETVRKIKLSQDRMGDYVASFSAGADQRAIWHVKVETPDWRLTGEWHDPAHSALRLK